MNLNITMRYIMVQAQRETSGGQMCVEHIYKALLALCEKNENDIARSPDHLEQVHADLADIRRYISSNGIDAWPTCYLLGEALVGNLPEEVTPEPDKDLPGLLARAENLAQQQGQDLVSASTMLHSIKKDPGSLVHWCDVKCGVRPTPKNNAVTKAQAVLRQKMGGDSGFFSDAAETVAAVHTAAAETVLHPAARSLAAETILHPAVTEPLKPAKPNLPKPDPGSIARPVPPVSNADDIRLGIEPKKQAAAVNPKPAPVAPKAEVVFINIPAPGAAAQQQKNAARRQPPKVAVKPQKINIPKRKTKMAGITFRGGPVAAAVKYFLALIIPVAALSLLSHFNGDLLHSYLAHLENRGPFAMASIAAVVFCWIALALRGITGLLGLRFKSFEIFANTPVNIAWGVALGMIMLNVAGYRTIPTFAKVMIVLYAFMWIWANLGRVMRLARVSGRQIHRLRITIPNLYGTPESIFFQYVLMSCLLPLFVFAIIWIWNLKVNGFWRAAFSICCFFWVCQTIQVLLHSWNLIYQDSRSARFLKLNHFLLMEYYILALPVFGWFLMWYFNWLPMPTWVIVLYGIYGFFSLWLILGLLVVFTRKGAEL